MGDELISALNKKRGGLKAQLTTATKKLSSIQEPMSRMESQDRLERLKELRSKFDDVQTQIEEILDESHAVTQAEERQTFDDRYYELLSLIAAKTVPETPIMSPASPLAPTLTSTLNSSNTAQKRIDLPTIQVPFFYGKIEDFPPFWDLFNSLIHNCPQLDDIRKLHYLKTALKGEAQHLISSLATVSTNYKIAYDLLKDRYENKKILVNTYLKNLMSEKPLTTESSVALRKLLDSFVKNINCLKNVNQPVEQWNSILVYLLSSKFDSTTRREWELSSPQSEIPDFDVIVKFLEKRIQALDASNPTFSKPSFSKQNNVIATKTYAQTTYKCFCCEEPHQIYRCEKFKKLPVCDRLNLVKQKNLCPNCFSSLHKVANCKSESCKKCDQRHHTLIHQDNLSRKSSCDKLVSASAQINNPNVLLSTIAIFVHDNSGNCISVRALLDQGSQSHYITDSLIKKLCLSPKRCNVEISGIASSKSVSNYAVSCKISSRVSSFATAINAIVLKKITPDLPSENLSNDWLDNQNIQLADPNFHIPGRIDMLIGGEFFLDLLLPGNIPSNHNRPALQNTLFGWIVGGKYGDLFNDAIVKTQSHCSVLTDQLKKFWEIEESLAIPEKILTDEELACETHYVSYVKRLPDGRFSVRLPFKKPPSSLGESRDTAIRVLRYTQMRLNDHKRTLYANFMDEYEQLGHMKPVEYNNERPNFYLPHHAVLKPSSETTKFRVVFNASKPSSSGVSLNDTLMVGPQIQPDLFTILTKFRTHEIAICADIEKMYRQIQIDEADRAMQRIVWYKNGKIQDYELTTVTYGTASASFLAIRSLHEVAKQHRDLSPLAAETILHDFNVDDLISGANDEKSAISLINDISAILQKGQFPLRKWRSNSKIVLENLISKSPDSVSAFVSNEHTSSALGLMWNHDSDNFCFSLHAEQLHIGSTATKREILSKLSRIFDPLGMLSPIIVRGKLILRQLWLEPLGWDDPLPEHLIVEYNNFYANIKSAGYIEIPRFVKTKTALPFQLCGFADASEQSYAACVYVRVEAADNSFSVRLVCSKTRVAPVKTISLPRLELCAATLLARLLRKIAVIFQCSLENVYAFSDSMIVLSWLAKPPSTWKTFVANRISEIQTLIAPHQWRYVRSGENSADIATRCIKATDLQNNTLWWNGSPFLSYPIEQWPQPAIVPVTTQEMKSPKTLTFVSVSDFDLVHRYSNLTKLLRVTAYCFRFVNALRKIPNRPSGPLNAIEIDRAKQFWVKQCQTSAFAQDLDHIHKQRSINSKTPLITVHRKSSLYSLSPILDNDGILRVGGRLENAAIDFQSKHPAILPKHHYLTELVIRHFHEKNLHAPLELLHSLIRQEFWIVNGKNTIKILLRKCITCIKQRMQPANPFMGNLPPPRVQISSPFHHTGIDYAGPFTLKPASCLRYRTTYKGYVAVFVCLATKAIHLELVCDLTSETFIACLKRFIARRGKPAHLYSDNGTTFVGANRQLKELADFLNNPVTQQDIQRFLANDNIQWHFIPPYSPNFGGIWEAGVKSMKRNLKISIGEAILSYEEINTVLAQCEAQLNSRPLCPASDDSRDAEPLTPGHFLIGKPLLAIPEKIDEKPISHLKRWRLTQQISFNFWKRWSAEYLKDLQHRRKWASSTQNTFQKNDLVLIREPSAISQQWKYGRISETHPGDDNIVRVVSVKTREGILRRPVNKIVKIDF